MVETGEINQLTVFNLRKSIHNMCAEIGVNIFWKELPANWSVLRPVGVVTYTHILAGGKRQPNNERQKI